MPRTLGRKSGRPRKGESYETFLLEYIAWKTAGSHLELEDFRGVLRETYRGSGREASAPADYAPPPPPPVD